MTPPRDIIHLLSDVTRKVPTLTISIDAPEDQQGEWWLDVKAANGFSTNIAWRPRQGFGFFTSTTSYGERPSEVFSVPDIAALRLTSLYAAWSTTGAISPPWLAELRELRGDTQSHLAKVLERNQPAISRLENREDVKISTLIEYIESLGGKLEIRAHFKEMDIELCPPRQQVHSELVD